MSNYVIAICDPDTGEVMSEEGYESEEDFQEALKREGRDCGIIDQVIQSDFVWSDELEHDVWVDELVTVAYVYDMEV